MKTYLKSYEKPKRVGLKNWVNVKCTIQEVSLFGVKRKNKEILLRIRREDDHIRIFSELDHFIKNKTPIVLDQRFKP